MSQTAEGRFMPSVGEIPSSASAPLPVLESLSNVKQADEIALEQIKRPTMPQRMNAAHGDGGEVWLEDLDEEEDGGDVDEGEEENERDRLLAIGGREGVRGQRLHHWQQLPQQQQIARVNFQPSSVEEASITRDGVGAGGYNVAAGSVSPGTARPSSSQRNEGETNGKTADDHCEDGGGGDGDKDGQRRPYFADERRDFSVVGNYTAPPLHPLQHQLPQPYQTINEMQQNGVNGNHQQLPFHRPLALNSQLEMEKNFEEGRSGPATLILTPSSLNATATATDTTATENANAKPANRPTASGDGDGGGRGGPGGGVGVVNGGRYARDEYKGPKVWRFFTAHWMAISQTLAVLAIFVAVWIIATVYLDDYVAPETGLMRIVFLCVGAQLVGNLVTLFHLPDMLGMLFFGVVFANVGWADFSGYQRLEAFLREMALINIMLLAGLGLDAGAFRKLWVMILRLTLVPTFVEVAVIAVMGRYVLTMPWLWSILLGLIITAISPNVVVTVMLKLKEDRLGMNKGIHTLIYAMTTCNDVVAIFLFGVVLSIIFSTDSLTEKILQGPIGIGIGIVFGYVYGLMLQFLPSKNASYVNGLRFVLTTLGGCIAVMGSRAIGYPSAGALGCVTLTFFASMGWKRQQQSTAMEDERQQWHTNANATVPQRLDLLWKFLKPVSFALIGKEINFAILEGRIIGYGALLVLLGSLLRLIFAYVSTHGGDLTWKERAYITISGFPKATVQAALGPIALDMARAMSSDPETVSLASNVLIISVLAIIFTAPLGAVLMVRLAPRWLEHSGAEDEIEEGRRRERKS